MSLGACSTEPDQVSPGSADHIVAEPAVVFVSRTDSQNVRIRVVDQQGTSVLQPISISTVGPGISVRADSAFRPIYHGDTLVFNPNTTELRVWVSTSELDNSSFSITSGDLTLDVPVVVTPNSAESFPFSTLTPALGEVVTASVTSDLLFTDSTLVIFGGDTLTPVSVAPDGTTLTFNAGPDLLGPAKFTNVTLTYNKNVVFGVTASDTLNSPSGTQPFTFSNLTPALGEHITVTAPAGVIFTDSTEVSFDSAGPTPRFVIAGDGTSMDLEAGPNSVGPTTFTNLINAANPTFTFSLTSEDTLVSAVVDTFQAAVSDNTPAVGQFVTVTGGSALFRFSPKSTFAVDGRPALAWTIAADSNSASVLFEPGVDGNMSVDSGLVSLFKMGDLPSNQTITADEVAFLAGTGAFATAPSITDPAVGDTTAFWDGAPYDFNASADFGGGARLYKLVLGANQTIKFQLPYISDGADLGVYFYDASFSALSSAVDSKGGGGASGTANAESGDVALTAGTYYVAIVYFNYSASPKPAAHYLFRMIGQ